MTVVDGLDMEVVAGAHVVAIAGTEVSEADIVDVDAAGSTPARAVDKLDEAGRQNPSHWGRWRRSHRRRRRDRGGDGGRWSRRRSGNWTSAVVVVGAADVVVGPSWRRQT